MKKIFLLATALLLSGGYGVKVTTPARGKTVQRAIYADGLGDFHTFPQTTAGNLLTAENVYSSQTDSGGMTNIKIEITSYVDFVRNGDQSDVLFFITNASVMYDMITLIDYDGNMKTHPCETFTDSGATYSYVIFDYSSFEKVTGERVFVDFSFDATEVVKNEYYLFEGQDQDSPGSFLEGKADTQGPLISGANVNYYTNVESPISVETIKSKLTAVDETDGDVSDSIAIAEDNYTGHEAELGAHTIKFSAQDLSGNVSYLSVTIHVRDVTGPVIEGPETVTYSYDDIISEDQFLLNYSISDNCDPAPSLTTSYPTNIFDKANALGTYTVNVNGTDASGNTATKAVQVQIVDEKAPVIEGPTTISKRNSVVLTTSEILAQYSANDAYDGACTVYIVEDNFTGNGDKVGTYTIKLGAKDSSNNEGTKVLTIEVIDDIAPVWYVDNTLIYVDASVTLTHQDIIDLMIANGEIASNYALVTITNDEYEADPTVPGTYSAKVRVLYANGNEIESTKTIEVLEEESGIKAEKKSFWDKVLDFFRSIGNWFVRLWETIVGWFK